MKPTLNRGAVLVLVAVVAVVAVAGGVVVGRRGGFTVL